MTGLRSSVGMLFALVAGVFLSLAFVAAPAALADEPNPGGTPVCVPSTCLGCKNTTGACAAQVCMNCAICQCMLTPPFNMLCNCQ